MNIKIVSDSSSNILEMQGLNYTTVPLKINAGDMEFIDNKELDVAEMVAYLKKYKGKSGSSCPNAGEWLDAFQGADYVIAMTISRELSGSYSAALNAADTYMEENPGAQVWVLDSVAAGPEMGMLLDKVKELIDAGLSFEEIKAQLTEYHKHLHTLFCLQSLTNLARNGRVSPAVATVAGVLDIRPCGDVTWGQITDKHKPRGQKKAVDTLVKMMDQRGMVDGALVRIAHCFGEDNALALKAKVLEKYPNCTVAIEPTTALCSFYAEAGGLMIGIEAGIHPTKYQ